MSKENLDQIEDVIEFDPKATADAVIDMLEDGTVVNLLTKKPKFDKKTGDLLNAGQFVDLTESGVFYALGKADVTAYYYNPEAGSKLSAGVVDNFGMAQDSLVFARGAKTKKIYASGADVTVVDAAAGNIFAGSYSKFDKKALKNDEAYNSIVNTEADSTITVMNSAVKTIYAGGEGDDIMKGDVAINLYNAKVGKIYAGGKAGAYTSGDTTITISNADNQNFKGANSVFTGKIYGYAGDKNSMTWGETDVIVDNYTGAYKGSFEYVDSITVKGASDVTFTGNFKEVDKITVEGAATAVVKKGGAYTYDLVLTSETAGNNKAPMLYIYKALTPDKVTVIVNDDYANTGAVNLLNWVKNKGSKNNPALEPTYTVKNERGGIVADYMYSFTFDANNQLIFDYTGKAFELDADWVSTELVVSPGNANVYPIPDISVGNPLYGFWKNDANEYVFGAADDVIVADDHYDFTNARINLGAGYNQIDLNAAQGNFELEVTAAGENYINAEDFAGSVEINDISGKTSNTVLVGNASGAVDFKGSADATLIVDGAYGANVDFSSVKGTADVVLENGAMINLNNVQAGAAEVQFSVDDYNVAAIRGLNVDHYMQKKVEEGAEAGVDYNDFGLNIGKNAVIIGEEDHGAPTAIVSEYNKNMVITRNVTITEVNGDLSSNILVDDGATLTIENYGKVSADIDAVNQNFNVGVADRGTADVTLRNYGEFTGSINMGEQNGNDLIRVVNLEGDGLDSKLSGTVALGGGADKFAMAGNDVVVDAAISKYNEGTLDIVVRDGNATLKSDIVYTKAGADDSERVAIGAEEADELATAWDNTTLKVNSATFKNEVGTLTASAITLNNGKIEGAFNAQLINVRNENNVIAGDNVFTGYDDVAATVYVNADAELTTGNLTAGYITVDDAYIAADSLTALNVDIEGSADVAGAVNATAVLDEDAVYVAGSGNVTLNAKDADDYIKVGDINAVAVEDAVFEDVVYGGAVALQGEGTVETGAINAESITFDATNMIFNGMIATGDVDIKEGKSMTFRAGADFEDVAITDDGDKAAVINVENTGIAFDNLAVNDNAYLDLNLNGQTIVVDDAELDEAGFDIINTTLGDNAVIDIDGGNFVGGILETGTDAAVVLRNGADVDKVVFTGSTVAVENAGSIGELLIENNLNVFGIVSPKEDAADVLTVENGIVDKDGLTATVNVANIEIVGDIDVAAVNAYNEVKLGYVNANVNATGIQDLAGNELDNDIVTIETLVGDFNTTNDKVEAAAIGTLYGSAAAATDLTVGNFVDRAVLVDGQLVTDADGNVIINKDMADVDVDTITADSVAITGQLVDIKGGITATDGSIAITGAADDVDVRGALSATDGDITVENAEVEGSISITTTGDKATNDGDSYEIIVPEVTVNATLSENYAGIISATAVADTTIVLNINGWINNIDFDFNGEGNIIMAGGIGNNVWWNQDGTIVNGATRTFNAGNVVYTGDYLGNVAGTADSITIAGNVFGSWTDGVDFTKSTIAAKNVTIGDAKAGEYLGTDFFSRAEVLESFIDGEYDATNAATFKAMQAVSNKFNGMAYADIAIAPERDELGAVVDSVANVKVDKLFVGSISANESETDLNIELKDAQAALDTIEEIDLNITGAGKWNSIDDKIDEFNTVAASVEGTIVDNIADGNEVFFKADSVKGKDQYFVNEDFADGHDAREMLIWTTGADVKATTIDVANDFFGQATADYIKVGGTFAGGKLEVVDSKDALDNVVYHEGILNAAFAEIGGNFYGDFTSTYDRDFDENGSNDGPFYGAFKVAGDLANYQQLNVGFSADGNRYQKLEDFAGNTITTGKFVATGTYDSNNDGVTIVADDIFANGCIWVNEEWEIATDKYGNYIFADQVDSDYWFAGANTIDIASNVLTIANLTANRGSIKAGSVEGNATAQYGDILIDGDIIGSTLAENVTITGFAEGDITAVDATYTIFGLVQLGSDVIGNITADTVKGLNANEKFIEGNIDANELDLANTNVIGDVQIGTVDGTHNGRKVVIGDIDGNLTYNATYEQSYDDLVNGVNKELGITAGNLYGNTTVTVIDGPTSFRNETFKMNIEGLGGNVTYDELTQTTTMTGSELVLNGWTARIEEGENADQYVNSMFEVNAAETINGNITLANGNAVISAKALVGNSTYVVGGLAGDIETFNGVNVQANGGHADANNTLVFNVTDMFIANVSAANYDVTFNGNVFNGVQLHSTIDANGIITWTPVAYAPVTMTADKLTFTKATALTLANITAKEVVANNGITLDGVLTADVVNGNLTAAEAGLNITKAMMKLVGDLTAVGAVTANGITLTKKGAVVNAAKVVSGGITIDTDATIAQLNGGALYGTDKANNVTFKAATDDAQMKVGSLTLYAGDDTVTFASATEIGAVNGGDGVDTLNINAAVNGANITNFENVVFGADGALTGTWAIDFDQTDDKADTVKFAAAGKADTVVASGVTINGLDADDFVIVGGAQWTWSAANNAFVQNATVGATSDALEYNAGKLTWKEDITIA